ncbi:MAG: N-6 DNA methylase, partial [Lentisphaerae bacterium]|nr:N-6 DNA methylase [Lentisphaerota bacterium]
VDIQTIAVQISKLRFFISLVCEQEPNGRKADNYGILPLPNLETKFVAANTLIGLEKEMGDELHLADEEISRLREELKEVRHRHFSSKSSAEKQKLRKKDKELRQKIEKRIVSVASTPNLEKIADLEAQIRKLEAEKAKFEGEKWVKKAEAILLCEDGHVEPVIRIDENMAQRKRFQADIDRKKHEIDAEKRKKATDALLEEAEKLAAWNPYDQNESSPFFDPEWMFGMKDGFDVALGNPPYLNVELVPAAQKEFYQQHYTTFYKRYDVFGLFFEAALTRCVSRDGKVSFIIPQQIANNLSYKKLRDLILKNSWLAEVLYLGDKVFEAANNDVCVLILDKSGCKTIRLIHALDFTSRTVTVVPANHFERYGNVISFSGDSGGEAIFAKVFSAGRWQIKERFSVFQGIVTGNNEAFLPTNEQIREAKIEKSLLRPVLLGRDFEKWAIRSTERRIIYVNGDTDIKKYPNAERWLAQFRQSLKKRRECVNGVIPWFSLQWPRVKEELDRVPKIMVQGTRNPRLVTRIAATMDEQCVYGTQGLNFIVPRDAKAPIYYLLAILNSKLINHLFATKFLNVAIKAEYLKDTPIPRAEPRDEKALEKLAQCILSAKMADPSIDISKWEQEIDAIVYKLYGLTTDEIAIVEGASTSPKKAEKQEKAPRTVKVKSKSVLVDDEGLD